MVTRVIFQATSLPTPSFQAIRRPTLSFQATRQQALSFQAMGQTTPSIQPTPSFQETSLPTPSFQATRQQTASFQATTPPTPSFQATGQTTLSFHATGQTTPSFQPPVNPTPAQATSNKRAKRESSHHWTVDGIDSHGDTKKFKLKTRDALSLPRGECVVVEFDCLDQIGEAQGLLAGPHFCFMTIEEVAREYVYRSIAKKWAASRKKLWHEFKDPLKIKDEIMDNVQVSITQGQWTSFVNYHYKEETQMAETGRNPGRAQFYLATHTKNDGSYVNDEAKEICETIELAVSESIVDESGISPNDVVGKVLGKEHSERVRCLELGATSSNTFRETNLRLGNIRIVSNNVGCSSFWMPREVQSIDEYSQSIHDNEGRVNTITICWDLCFSFYNAK
nr:uncharacterized protein LOC108948483 isoform X2 [Nicotiana tomentosiformis]